MDAATKRKVKFFTMLAVMVLFVLILLMVTLLIQQAQLKSTEEQLKKNIAELDGREQDIDSRIAYYQTLEWIEQRARELGLIGPNEKLYQMQE